MSKASAIEWTDSTWNPVTGCTKVSPGCAHCYAETFAERFEDFYRARLRRKLGLAEARDDDAALAADLLTRMADNRADFTLTFRRLCDVPDEGSGTDERARELFRDPVVFDDWAVRWRKRLASEGGSDPERRQRTEPPPGAAVGTAHL